MKKYTYKIETFNGKLIMSVEFKNTHAVSISDMETAITEIEIEKGIKAEDYMIVYKYTIDKWDGYDARIGSFVAIAGTNIYHAINRWVKMGKSSEQVPTVGDVRRPQYKK